ncbi:MULTISPECIES: DUF3177 family protein [unclassified Synechococcus]|uniref:DUF3177 family protein n=1 Tax=unclassified Synechococcus TaxID=2626047 RepID=UPI0020CFC446|nr:MULTISPECIES: DUF3177 family protein [unclassified Synechococcus]MCP9938879.1 DUF3177 family protein [Synechococcus sp. Cruz CV12-2-Slac-r]MCX5929407.1 DUF3177 family protein [Synechococcus sp. LacPavin_0920_WC12_MAG_50_7]
MALPLLRSLVWMIYRLELVFAVGLPLVLLVWAAMRQEPALVRLLNLYWKVSSLLGITVLLMAAARPMAFITATLAQLLIVVSLWFWVDLNEELADLPPFRALPFTMRLWRWALTALSLLGFGLSAMALGCAWGQAPAASCALWLEAPGHFQGVLALVLGFFFGAQWTAAVSGFFGYLGLAAYGVGIIQWLLVRLPRQGRLAGGF